MNIIILISLPCCSSLLRHFCSEEIEEPNLISESRNLYQIPRNQGWSSIRISSIWEASPHQPSYKPYLENSIKFYQNSLKVHPLSQSIPLSSPHFCLPDKSFLNNSQIFSDFTITVKFINDSSKQYAASAYPCISCNLPPCSPPHNQPITGHMKLNLAYLPDYSPDQLQMIFTHELTHALGFTRKLFTSFSKNSSNEAVGLNIFLNTSIRGASRVLFAGETVKTRARSAFACESLQGLELENQGGNGIALSHWERRVMFNDFMNPQVVDGPAVYSDLSLAVLADSGWYQVNFDYADKVVWGSGKGCEFVLEKCADSRGPRFEEFCSPGAGCSFDFKGFGECLRDDESEDLIEEEYDYFGNGTRGDWLADFCPIVKTSVFCVDEEDEDVEGAARLRGEKRGRDSWCVMGSIGMDKELERNQPGCFEIKCFEDALLIKVKNEDVFCFSKGQIVTVNGFKGNLTCPDIDKICGYMKIEKHKFTVCNDEACLSFGNMMARIISIWLLI